MPQKRYYRIKIYDAEVDAIEEAQPLAETYVCLNGNERSIIKMNREARKQYRDIAPANGCEDVVLFHSRILESAYVDALKIGKTACNITEKRIPQIGLFTLIGAAPSVITNGATFAQDGDESPFLTTHGEVGNSEDEPPPTSDEEMRHYERLERGYEEPSGEALPFSPNLRDGVEEQTEAVPATAMLASV